MGAYTLREPHFFRFCVENDWILKSHADLVPMPKNLQVADREPYSPNEVTRIIAAWHQVRLPLHAKPKAALSVLPFPQGANGPDYSYLFGSGHGLRRAFITVAGRAVAAEFEASESPARTISATR